MPLLRAANTGISAAFDARGHELARLGMQQMGILAVTLPAALPPPLHARVGLWLPFGAGILAVIAGFAARKTRRISNLEAVL